MHLVDLDQAARRTTELPPALSTDGIAEVLEVFLPRMHARGYAADLTAPLTIRTLDTDHVWTLQPRADGPPLVAVRYGWLSPAYSAATLAFGVAQMASPQVGGVIADWQGSFTAVFLLSAVVAVRRIPTRPAALDTGVTTTYCAPR